MCVGVCMCACVCACVCACMCVRVCTHSVYTLTTCFPISLLCYLFICSLFHLLLAASVYKDIHWCTPISSSSLCFRIFFSAPLLFFVPCPPLMIFLLYHHAIFYLHCQLYLTAFPFMSSSHLHFSSHPHPPLHLPLLLYSHVILCSLHVLFLCGCPLPPASFAGQTVASFHTPFCIPHNLLLFPHSVSIFLTQHYFCSFLLNIMFSNARSLSCSQF